MKNIKNEKYKKRNAVLKGIENISKNKNCRKKKVKKEAKTKVQFKNGVIEDLKEGELLLLDIPDDDDLPMERPLIGSVIRPKGKNFSLKKYI
jgi:hypothetical protein